MNRCDWAKTDIEIAYHDMQWGVPTFDDETLFEFLILEGMQAGLSWVTILKKREHMREAFSSFDVIKIASYSDECIETLMQNKKIIRNRLKLNALRINANKFIEIQEQYGSFSKYIWSFVDFKPIQNNWKEQKDVPASTELSDKISNDLKKRGFKFVGSIIVYSFMQATGMVNDHLVACYKHKEILHLK